MHSSRMHTGRTLTVFRWRTPPENLEEPPQKIPPPKIWRNPHPPTPPKIPPQIWRNPPQKIPPQIRAKSGAPPPVNRITDTCKNITLAKTSFRPVIKPTVYFVLYCCIYRPQMRFAKVMFLHLFVSHSVHRGCIPACLAGFQAHTQGELEGSGWEGLQAHAQGASPGPHPGGRVYPSMH